MTPTKQRAWLVYYRTIADDPEATPEEHKRAMEMLRIGGRIGIRDNATADYTGPNLETDDIKDFNPEDLA